MRLRDELGTTFKGEAFAALYPRRGQPAEAPWRLALLVTLLQFAERLTNRQAVDAVRSRIDWKYLLGLELTDKGFHYSVMCEFSCRLLESGAEALLFEQLLTLFKARGLLKEWGKQRTDSTHIIAAVRKLSRVELVWRHFRLTGKGTWSPARWANRANSGAPIPSCGGASLPSRFAFSSQTVSPVQRELTVQKVSQEYAV